MDIKNTRDRFDTDPFEEFSNKKSDEAPILDKVQEFSIEQLLFEFNFDLNFTQIKN